MIFTKETKSTKPVLFASPQDYPTIQAAINAAQSGDVIIVSPATYYEALMISGKTITLASEFYLTNDPARIGQTIIDGGGATNDVITVDATAGPETQIIGFTLQNADDGILTMAMYNHTPRSGSRA